MPPNQKDVEVPLLQVLAELGGRAEPRDVYPLVTATFPALREEDIAEVLPSGGNQWTNRIQWVRQRLVVSAHNRGHRSRMRHMRDLERVASIGRLGSHGRFAPATVAKRVVGYGAKREATRGG